MAERISLEVGSILLLDLIYRRGNEVRIAKNVVSRFVGCDHGQYVTLSIDEPEKYHYFFSNLDGLVAKYIRDGKAFAFRAELLRRTDAPAPLFFISYPEDVESFNLRKEVRARCNPTASVVTQEKTLQGLLVDISQSGCRIDLLSPTTREEVLKLVDIELCFHLPGIEAALSVDAGIRWVRMIEERVCFGASFLGMSESSHSNITKFLASSICSF